MTEYSGSGDAKRRLELLWGQPAQPRPGPKPRLSVDQIATVAIGIADIHGLAALSMRRLAEQLGSSVMALYTYVPSKAELIDLMLDRVSGELPLLEQLPGTWRARVETWAHHALASYRRHPWVLHVATTRPPLGPHEVAWADSALRVVGETGLADPEIVAVIGIIDAVVRGLARPLVDAAEAEQHTGMTDAAWMAANEPLLERLIQPARFPTLTRFHYGGVFDAPIDQFEFGLQRLLDGIERHIAEYAQAPGEAPATRP